MRFDRLAGIVFIVIGALALFGRSLGAGSLQWGEERLLEAREQRIGASAVGTLQLDVEAGSLVVLGEAGRSSVDLRAEYLGASDSVLPHLELAHSVSGDVLLVETRTGSSRGRINLELTVPSGLELRIDDGSGSIRIETIDGRVSIQDGSGSITVRDLGGDLRVQDGSGSIAVQRVAGAVEIRDGSGSISVTDAGRSVSIEDSSGSISVRGVGGDVIVRDGSGSITVRDVDGRFHLAADGSGSVSTSGIRGGIDS